MARGVLRLEVIAVAAQDEYQRGRSRAQISEQLADMARMRREARHQRVVVQEPRRGRALCERVDHRFETPEEDRLVCARGFGDLSGDDALQLLLRIALQLTDERSPFELSRGSERERIVARVKQLHAGIVEALVERNEALAIRRMRRYLSGLREWLE